MTKIHVKHVDTFTTVPHTGNPAAVVMNADGLTTEQMLSVSREINLSETAFILTPESGKGQVRIRCFTPAGELESSGHASLAAVHALVEAGKLGMAKDGEYQLQIETMKGLLSVKVVRKRKNIGITLILDLPEFENGSQYKVDLIRVLNLSVSEFDPGLSVQRNGFLFAPIRRLHTLFTMKPNMEAISTFLGKRGFEGICVFTTETVDRNSLVHSRVFAPHVGIPEDPVTGFTHRSIALYLQEKRLIPRTNGRYVFQAEQGDVMGRKGRLEVEIIMENEQPKAVAITASAVTVLNGDMVLPE